MNPLQYSVDPQLSAKWKCSARHVFDGPRSITRAGALSITHIVNPRHMIDKQRIERYQMCVHEINEVNVVSNSGAIRSGIIRSVDLRDVSRTKE